MDNMDDGFPTATSISQKSAVALLVKPPISSSSTSKIPQGILDTNLHLGYLGRHLLQGLPVKYTSQDASQSWLLFWSLQSLSILKVELDEGNKQRASETILAMQNPLGGFGGGPGQAPHLLPTYAAICTMGMVGSPSTWCQINRPLLYQFFMSLKEPDGSFRVSQSGEVDIRGVYCLLAVAKLLGIMTEELVEGTREWVKSCQTYEGGFASAAIGVGEAGTPLGEAHGGYTFCALAAWVLLESQFPVSNVSKPINLKSLRRWLVNMQGGEEELYGFRGRTNKLVDGCYSWWVGGCFKMLDELDELQGRIGEAAEPFWNPEGLKQYILYAAQHPAGGLRDKPPKSSDLYHTLYCLAGLSIAQYAGSQSQAQTQPSEPFSQSAHPQTPSPTLSNPPMSLNATDPLFNLTKTHAEAMMMYFKSGDLEPFR